GRALQRLHAVARFDDVEARELEVLGVHLARVGIIVVQQDPWPDGLVFVLFLLLIFLFLAHLRPLTGSVNEKVEPRPTWRCTAIRPSSICASRRQIDSPSPVPPYARVGELSSCRKSSNIFS